MMGGFFDWLKPVTDILTGKSDILTALDPLSGGAISRVRQVIGAPGPVTVNDLGRPSGNFELAKTITQRITGGGPLRMPTVNGGWSLSPTEKQRRRTAQQRYGIQVTTPGGYQFQGGADIVPFGADGGGGSYGRPRGSGQYVMATRRVDSWPVRVWPRRMNPLNRRAGRRAIRRVRSMKRLMGKLLRLMPSRPGGGGRVSHVPRGYRHVRRRGDLDPFYLEDQLDVRDELADLEEQELEIPFDGED